MNWWTLWTDDCQFNDYSTFTRVLFYYGQSLAHARGAVSYLFVPPSAAVLASFPYNYNLIVKILNFGRT